jgi:hypothetical protein
LEPALPAAAEVKACQGTVDPVGGQPDLAIGVDLLGTTGGKLLTTADGEADAWRKITLSQS